MSKEATLKGILPSTAYEVRLSASNGAGTTNSTLQTFTTLASAPMVATQSAGQVAQDSAILRGSVDPAGEPTTYYFEYGPSPDYGELDPGRPGRQRRQRQRGQLVARRSTACSPEPSTTTASSPRTAPASPRGQDQSFMTATTPSACANEAIRERQGTQYLPDCRAFELVSPADKNGGDVMTPDIRSYGSGDFAPMAGVGGDQVAFTSHAPFSGAESHPVFSVYRAIRGADGWNTENLIPYMDGSSTRAPYDLFHAFNEDLSSWVGRGPAGAPAVP